MGLDLTPDSHPDALTTAPHRPFYHINQTHSAARCRKTTDVHSHTSTVELCAIIMNLQVLREHFSLLFKAMKNMSNLPITKRLIESTAKPEVL